MKNKNIKLGLLAATAAAALGYYFIYGKNAKEHRKNVKGWMLKMKGEILEKLEKMEHISRAAYEDVVEAVAAGYRKIKEIDPDEITGLVDDLKRHWNNIERDLEKGSKRKSAKTAKSN